MFEFLTLAFKLDHVGWFLLLIMALSTIYMVHHMLDDTIVTVLSVPAALLCATSANHLLSASVYLPSTDRVVNTSFGFGVGFVGFALLLAMFFVFKRLVLQR